MPPPAFEITGPHPNKEWMPHVCERYLGRSSDLDAAMIVFPAQHSFNL